MEKREEIGGFRVCGLFFGFCVYQSVYGKMAKQRGPAVTGTSVLVDG